MKRILFIIPSLRAGGAERVIVHLSEGFVQKGFDVTIAMTKWNEIHYTVDPKVDIQFLENDTAHPIQQIKYIRRLIREDRTRVVISFITMQNLYTFIAAMGLKNRIIVSERNDPSKTVPNKFIKWLRDILYLRADAIVFQTEDAKRYFRQSICRKGVVIGNPVSQLMPKQFSGIRDKRLVTVARLEPQKNITLLLDVSKVIFENYPEYSLEIYGVGNLEKELKKYAENIGISKKVHFMGYQNEIPEKIRSASVFVLASDYEGISNAMLEAMAVGLPCVCTDCPIGGAKTYIRDMENGMLVPVRNKDKMTEAILSIIMNPELGEKLGNNAVNIRDKLSLEKIIGQWEELIIKSGSYFGFRERKKDE